MDRRSWPWKKKSSDKAAAEKAVATSDSPATAGTHGDKTKQDSYKKPNYVQISVESYSHLTGLEDQIKLYEDQVKTYEDQAKAYEDQVQNLEDQVQSLEDQVAELDEKLSAANTEMTAKENLVKQHAKVAEEAVSGWEKAEAEAAALKNHLESVTLLKLSAEDRASHLDGALKECMRQIRNLKEEHEQNIHEVVLTKTKQCDRIKLEFEAKIANLDQELLRAAAENAALSRSLQERSNMLIKLSEEKSEAEAEIELLKSNIDSCEREINTLKYELNIVAKELEIRNEEKNMSVRSAEIANKQHLEGVKKIAKLEAECQRLRGLVRKKLPGPAALAQMKLEVESLGRDYGETRPKRSPVKPPTSPHFSPTPEFSLESVQKYQKENELLTERLLEVEEETKMLKEALAKRSSELQASRSVCAKTVSKLQSLEAQLLADNQLKGAVKLGSQNRNEGFVCQNASNPPSLTSMSEEGNDDEASVAGSWATAMISEPSHVRKEKNIESPKIAENASNHLELMDDFLEMEKLAYSSNDSQGAVSSSDASSNMRSDVVNHDIIALSPSSDLQPEEQPDVDPSEKQNGEPAALAPQADGDLLPIVKLQSRISVLLESLSKDTDMEKVFEAIKQVVQGLHDGQHQDSETFPVETIHCADPTSDHHDYSRVPDLIAEKEISLSTDNIDVTKALHTNDQELTAAIVQIRDFILILSKEAKAVHVTSAEGNGLVQKMEEFSTAFNNIIDNKIGLPEFVLSVSQVLGKASELRFSIVGYESIETESSSPDCIDKVALPENKLVQGPSGEGYLNGCAHFSDSTSDPDIPHEGNSVPTSELNVSSWKCSLEEFEQLKLEKESMVIDLDKCNENLESTKSQLHETEQLLAEVRSQLTSAQKLNGLAETQLKCMAESYNSLEARSGDLQTQVNLLQAKIESLDNELQEERKCHEDAVARCKDLQEQLERIESLPAVDDAKSNQERELTAAAEKLAECQETIFLLGKQLQGLRPQTEFMGSPFSERIQRGEGLRSMDEEPTISDQAEMGNESPMHLFTNTLFNSASDSEGNNNNLLRSPIRTMNPKHRPTKSGSSSSSSSNPTPEKNSRGFSRFFSNKQK